MGLLTFFFLTNAAAHPFLIGHYLPRSENSASTCRIKMGVEKPDEFGFFSQYQAICSGTLIQNRDRIVSAAHCFDPLELGGKILSTQVTCGGVDRLLEGVPMIHPLYRHTDFIERDASPADLSLMQLKPSTPSSQISNSGIKISSSLDQAFSLLQHGPCRLSGFGSDNSGSVGQQHTVLAPRDFLKGTLPPGKKLTYDFVPQNEFPPLLIGFLPVMSGFFEKTLHLSPDPNVMNQSKSGDSGGSLTCWDSSANQWTLVAVLDASNTAGFVANLVNSVMNQEWLQANL